MFIDQEAELIALNAILTRPQAQFLVTYGRRWVGKPTLLLALIRRSRQPSSFLFLEAPSTII